MAVMIRFDETVDERVEARLAEARQASEDEYDDDEYDDDEYDDDEYEISGRAIRKMIELNR